ncbi:hypothetical protein QUF54_06410 [Candidatus Marithioploca araucensis]|uniref:Uncharacterized protein n=1 Tax=Candidatus Marithioploca araucensis TaxID=70273 RepID=A0ABT7VTS4_9GAMM|nr:hypothetical protein [Candidatus Marithioploca araucensis]
MGTDFSGSHALAWEPILDAPASCVSKHRRWRVVTAFPRQRVGTRKLMKQTTTNHKPGRVGNVFLLPT